MKSKPFYGFGDFIGKQVRGEMNIFFTVRKKSFTMNARLCKRYDTFFVSYSLRLSVAKQHKQRRPNDTNKERFLYFSLLSSD